jgi:hypothetical protein
MTVGFHASCEETSLDFTVGELGGLWPCRFMCGSKG